MSTTQDVLKEVAEERARQDVKFPNQHLPNGTGGPIRVIMAEIAKAMCDDMAKCGKLTWFEVLNEEFFEAIAESTDETLRKELLQVASVAVRWIEDIDRRNIVEVPA